MAKKLSAWNLHVRKTAKANPKLYGAALLKKASRTYNKKTGKSKSRARKTNKSRSITKSSGRRMGKRKFSLPMGIIAPMFWKLQFPIIKIIDGDYQGAANDLLWHFAAVDSQGKFNPDALKTWIPVIVGLLAHKYIGGAPLNLNRSLANAGVPLIRI